MKAGVTYAPVCDVCIVFEIFSRFRMGNMHRWGGPLSDAWHSQQVDLQHKILDRMRSFGMIPVLPAFGGYVPQSLNRIFPNVSLSRRQDWGRFNSTYCWQVFSI